MDILDVPVYVINLLRSTEKRERMKFRLSKVGFKYVSFIEAIQSMDKEVEFYSQNNNPWCAREQWYRDLACYGSHLKALKRLIDSTAETALICEDDILFHNDFVQIANKLISSINQCNLISFTYMISEPINQTYVKKLELKPEPGIVWEDSVSPPEAIYYGLWNIDKTATWGAQCYLIHRSWAEKAYSLLHRPVAEAISSEAIIRQSGGLMTSVPLMIEDNISSDRAPQDSPYHLKHFCRWNYQNYKDSDLEENSPLARMKPENSWPDYPFKK